MISLIKADIPIGKMLGVQQESRAGSGYLNVQMNYLISSLDSNLECSIKSLIKYLRNVNMDYITNSTI
jgi:hypothetical protein